MIIILMSTYNGEKYLAEQLDSILSQRNVDLKIVIRDDGSTDSTIRIILEYINTHPGKIKLIRGNNIGWKLSFMQLTEYAEKEYPDCQYFAFSDQDDIWLPQKINRALECMQTLPNGAQLYCSNLYYYRDGVNMGKIRKSKPTSTYKNCLVRNFATGCTEVFNRELLELVTKKLPTIIVAHDYWFYQVAVLCGSVYIDDEAYILYRQHENNQIGIHQGFINVWTRRLKDKTVFSGNRQRETQARELMRLVGNKMHPEGKNAVKKICDYRKSIITHAALLIDRSYTLGQWSNDFWLKLRILLKQL